MLEAAEGVLAHHVGVQVVTPVINPPQTGILGVCGITQRVKTGKDGEFAVYPRPG